MSTYNIALSVYKRKSAKIIPNTIMFAAMNFLSCRLKNVFEIAVVYKPSVFKPLKFYCTATSNRLQTKQSGRQIISY